MLSINQLMKYLRNHHQISVKSNQAQSLRNIGYYHGYKGYRFIRTPNQRIPFSSLDEVIALNKFDMQLKTLIYPKVMFIENALKSYVIEAVLQDSKSENLDVVFNKSITAYQSYAPGSQQYHKQYAKRMTPREKSIMHFCVITQIRSKLSTISLILTAQFLFGLFLNH